jgi:DNA-binding NarL/FixJ family response regulator
MDAPVTVLLVDDHLILLQGLARLLAADPHTTVVALASNGAGALAAVRTHSPDVVIMDQGLTDARGTDVAAEIKEMRPATHVVMLTASEDDQDLLAAIEAGCSGYVTKHRALDELVSVVHAAYAGEMVMPAEILARLLPQLTQRPRADEPKVSPRELEVLRLMADGLSNQAIGERLYLSTNTVRNHVRNILAKLGAHSKLEAVSIAVREDLIKFG